MKWLALHIDTSPAGLEPVENLLSALGIDSLVIEDEGDFRRFLEQNQQYWDYVDEKLDHSMAGKCRITFYAEENPEGFAQVAAARIALAELKRDHPDYAPLLLTLDASTLNYGVPGSTALNAMALGTVFGGKAGALIIAIGLSLFALSTVLSWGLYGTRCWEYLLGEKAVKPYQIIFTLVVIISATMDLSLAWAIADTLNGLMAIPNLIGLLLLCPVVFKMTREYFDSERRLRK